MISITDKTYEPNFEEIKEYTASPLFEHMTDFLSTELSAKHEIMYSGDKVLLGWNVRFYKSGRTLCRLYPQKGWFKILLVIGKKEKARTEELLPSLCEEMRGIYNGTQEGMGQRWMVYDLREQDALYEDTLRLIRVRKESK